jgi:hypothetical protein
MKTIQGSIKVEQGRQFETNLNIMHQDLFHMGQPVGNNGYMLFHAHQTEEARYVVIVNKKTGESVKVIFNPEE